MRSYADPLKSPILMLQALLQELKKIFPALYSSNQQNHFPVLAGCDDYSARLSSVQLQPDLYTKTFLLTADFSDAYTETQIPRLQESISVIGSLVGYKKQKIDLIKSLVSLVFNNCYFFTMKGLYRQTKGMPMGDYSSRDGLDVDLTRSEYEIVSQLHFLPLRVHLLCRLVDDISMIAQGDFQDLMELLNTMAERYPKMPLNIQLSYGYSRFLDLHVSNMLPSEPDTHYGLTTTLAYKESSTFTYTSAKSNIHPNYKCSVVPISLHRAHARCTTEEDVNHHIAFLNKIVKARDQAPDVVRNKFKNYFKKKKSGNHSPFKRDSRLRTTTVTYDAVTNQHKIIGGIIKESCAGQLQVVHKSRKNLSSLICPKKKIVNDLSKLI